MDDIIEPSPWQAALEDWINSAAHRPAAIMPAPVCFCQAKNDSPADLVNSG